MILSRQRLLTLAAIFAGALLVYGLLTAVWLSTAHAQVESPPPVPAAPVVVTSFQLETWLLGAAAAFAGITMIFSGIRTWLAWQAPRTPATWDDRALAWVTSGENLFRGLRDLITGGRVPAPLPVAPVSTATTVVPLAALGDVTTTTALSAPLRDPQSGRVRMALVTGLALVCGVAVLVASCATARQRGAAGVTAFLVCEAPNVDAALLEEAKGVSIAAIDKWISGDGHVDTAGLRSAAAPLKSDLLRCAFEAAIAAILTPAPKVEGAAMAAPRAVAAGELRTAWAGIRGELGWAPVQTAVQ